MTKFIKFIITFVGVLALFVLTDSQETEASAKVYREYSFPQEHSKFPMKLSNGLTIGKKKVNGEYIATVQKGNTILWEGLGVNGAGPIRFTVSKNKDTFLYFRDGAGGTDLVQIIGISAKGKVFLNKWIQGEGVGVLVDFLSPNTIEVAIERYNHDYIAMADRFTGEYTSKVYQLYVSGTMKEIPYLDKEFVSLAKKGQLKGVPGKINAQFKTLQSQPDFKYGRIGQSEVGLWYNMTKGSYLFEYGAYYDRITNGQKMNAIYKEWTLKTTRKVLGPQLKKLFGTAIFNSRNETLVYRAGKYYVAVYYNTYKGTAQLVLMNAKHYDLVKYFGTI